MLLSKLDFFSQPFLFNLDNNQLKKGTIQGAIVSFGIQLTVLVYFIYLTMLYLQNRIDPIFRSQSFITNDLIEIPLHEDVIVFRFQADLTQNLDSFEKQKNLTYIVPVALAGYQNGSNYETTYLNVTKCSSPALSNYYCLDYSNFPYKNLMINTNEQIFSYISLMFYSCLVTDDLKVTVPDNCANQTDIDNFVNGQFTQLHLGLYTQQYNTTSKSNKINYKTYQIFPQSNQYLINTQNIQNQVTKVRDGFIIQSEVEYSAPIQYVIENQTFPNQGNPYIQVDIQIDEVVQLTSIQYSTFPQILALVNSAFGLLMLLGIFCRKFANKSILQDFFCVFLQNMHQSLYEEVLKQNKLFEQKAICTQIETKADKLLIGQEINDKETARNINIPQFLTKSREFIEQSQQTQFNTKQSNCEDEILENEEEKKSPNNNDQLQDQSNSQQQENGKNKRASIENNLFIEGNNLANKVSIITQSNEMKNSNDSFQNINKAYSTNQLSIFSNRQSQTQEQKVLNETTKIAQSNGDILKINLQLIDNFILPQESKVGFNEQKAQNEQDLKKKKNFKALLEQHGINSTPKRNSNTIEYYIQKFKTIQDLNIFKKFTQINFGYRFTLQKLNCFKKQTPEQDQKNLSIQQKKFIEQQVLKSMNILELLKDVIFIKKSIMMLMTKEQLAAMKLVGYSENYIQDHYLKKEESKQLRKETYFEKQLDIFDSTDLSCQYIKKFIQKCNNSKALNQVDKRILSSINKNQTNLY
ncbi:AMP-binding enzyme family protein (macronuclear) [Tetrahymena thermophila SB210]|uniref:AMP-binding enzyme family protein n=1 Tax=Tetrahymena thermophila (strain SB210) TaxID=312017 RepID=Q23JL5_TETTS|nr:AMP-binding enzyme family protein [Tetrahymena thermophila SB210]EAR96728.2 AMP-binding enzyme family protein [Tetrahymena thermophila SB210]|eukprot:XP_001016973.2 AMP-binding enzyme family protein [Tetrahymena thermophila SB210]